VLFRVNLKKLIVLFSFAGNQKENSAELKVILTNCTKHCSGSGLSRIRIVARVRSAIMTFDMVPLNGRTGLSNRTGNNHYHVSRNCRRGIRVAARIGRPRLLLRAERRCAAIRKPFETVETSECLAIND
jgi:hypothetical protein